MDKPFRLQKVWILIALCVLSIYFISHRGGGDAERRHAVELRDLRLLVAEAQRHAERHGRASHVDILPVPEVPCPATEDAEDRSPQTVGGDDGFGDRGSGDDGFGDRGRGGDDGAGAGAAPAPPSKWWLCIGMPTVPRAHGEDYLLRTLTSITKEFTTDTADPFHGRAGVLVVNTHGAGHDRFDEAERLYASGPHRQSLIFRTSRDTVHILRDATGPNQGNPNLPGAKVRRQTRSIVELLKHAHGLATYFLFAEDDMQLCPHGLRVAHYLLQRASHYHRDWLAIRASFGMNGIFLRDGDVPVFSRYLDANQARRPPDHLITEWFAGETLEAKKYKASRPHVGFRYNLFHHIGSTSTLRTQTQAPLMPLCYDDLTVPVVFAIEAYNPRACPLDDMHPCVRMGGAAAAIPWGILRSTLRGL